MTRIVQPGLAGAWYPAKAASLRQHIEGFLDIPDVSGPVPKALVAPHAGTVFSGPIAGSAYARVRPSRKTITRVVLAAPAHRSPVRQVALSTADALATPLGEIPVDKVAQAAIASLPQVDVFDIAFETGDNTLELHLPFLQVALDDFSIVPIYVGGALLPPKEADTLAQRVAEVFGTLWGGPETLIVVSTDLSHFFDYETARRKDQQTSQYVEQLQPEKLTSQEQACGWIPVKGLLYAAREHGLTAEIADLRNSGDTAGSKDQVVGYGAYVFY